MKKIYLYYVIYLILGLITCNAFLSIINFNYFFTEYFDLKYSLDSSFEAGSKVVPYILINLLATGIISWLFNIFVKRKIRKKCKEELNINDGKKS